MTPNKQTLIGKTWNELSDLQKLEIITFFNVQPGRDVTSYTPEQAEWIRDCYLDVTDQEAAIDAISASITGYIKCSYRATTDGTNVVGADTLTNPRSYSAYYGILHNAPFLLLTLNDFPQSDPL